MHPHNPSNERIKRRYFGFLKEANRFSEPSIDAVAKALSRFEKYTKYRDFRLFHTDAAVAFKRHLAEQSSVRTGEALSKSTVLATLAALRNFVFWLAGQPGFKSRLTYSDAEYFNLSDKDTRVAKARREGRAPTIEQIQCVIRAMPTSTIIERRDRAVVALTSLTAARVGAIASLSLKHISLADRCIFQDARDVKTKNSKTFTTWFCPGPREHLEIVVDWVSELKEKLLWGNDDPLFPATRIVRGADGLFRPDGIDRRSWSSGGPIREVFKTAFSTAGLPYFHPHTFRRTLALLGEQLCRTAEEMKAWSQNLGHEKVQTTFSSYGQVPERRQAEIIASLAVRPTTDPRVLEAAARLLSELQRVEPSAATAGATPAGGAM